MPASRFTWTAALLTLLAVLPVGCIESQNPLIAPDKAKPDRRLYGAWMGKLPGIDAPQWAMPWSFFYVGPAGKGFPEGLTHVIEADFDPRQQTSGVADYWFCESRIAGATYLTSFSWDEKDSPRSGKWEPDRVKGHYFCRCLVGDDTATLEAAETFALAKAINAKHLKGKAVDEKAQRLTSSTDELVKYLESKDGAAAFGGELLKVRRLKHGWLDNRRREQIAAWNGETGWQEPRPVAERFSRALLPPATSIASKKSLVAPDDARWEEGVWGNWVAEFPGPNGKPRPVFYHIGRAGEDFPRSGVLRAIIVQFDGESPTQSETLFLAAEIGGAVYLCQVDLPPGASTKSWPSAIDGYRILKCEIDDDRVTLRCANADAVKAAIASKKIQGEIATDGSPRLTGSTADLARFFADSGAKLFDGEKIVLKRMDGPAELSDDDPKLDRK